MPDESDELSEYLQGGSALSHQYRREAAPLPPQALDLKVLDAVRPPQPRRQPRKSQSLAPLAFAASVFLSVALVLAIVFAPHPADKTDDKVHVLRVRAYRPEPPRESLPARQRNPAAWLKDIAAMRRAGRNSEADLEMQRFRSVYPAYLIPFNE
jgi:hypothetical protein